MPRSPHFDAGIAWHLEVLTYPQHNKRDFATARKFLLVKICLHLYNILTGEPAYIRWRYRHTQPPISRDFQSLSHAGKLRRELPQGE